MFVNLDYIKINMIINLTRDYMTLKEVANVGILYIEDDEKLEVNCSSGVAGMTFSIDLSDILEESDPSIMTKLLIAQLKTVGEG